MMSSRDLYRDWLHWTTMQWYAFWEKLIFLINFVPTYYHLKITYFLPLNLGGKDMGLRHRADALTVAMQCGSVGSLACGPGSLGKAESLWWDSNYMITFGSFPLSSDFIWHFSLNNKLSESLCNNNNVAFLIIKSPKYKLSFIISLQHILHPFTDRSFSSTEKSSISWCQGFIYMLIDRPRVCNDPWLE